MMALILPMVVLIMAQSWEASYIILPILTLIMSTHLFSPMGTSISLNASLTVDTFSVPLIMLTLWISNAMMLMGTKIKWMKANPSLFMTLTMSLTIILLLAFSVNTLLSFFIFFEASLIPTLMIILTWGYQPERVEAGMYLMLYTMTASLPLLLSITIIHHEANSSMLFINTPHHSLQMFMNISLTLAFLVKMPMYLTHLWLPKAHVEAPAAGSMILASILLKLGGYGLIRMGTMYPTILTNVAPIVIPISMWGAASTAILCIRQTDMKSMIAYSSVSHMALVITGIFSSSSWGWSGALTMMIAHGFISSGLFAMTNMYYENTFSRNLLMNQGLLMISPTMAMWWFLMIAANMAAPPFINLLAEITLMTSIMSYSSINALPLLMSSFFTACYSMVLYTSLHHGPSNSSVKFMEIKPIYFSINLVHVAPTLLLIFAADQLTTWL